jgi:hypothetical protein
MNASSVLSTKDKIGYGLGDMASALVWQTATLFLAYFYTDVFGLPAAIMGTMFLVVRVVDAFVDPCIGAMVDRTQTLRAVVYRRPDRHRYRAAAGGLAGERQSAKRLFLCHEPNGVAGRRVILLLLCHDQRKLFSA